MNFVWGREGKNKISQKDLLPFYTGPANYPKCSGTESFKSLMTTVQEAFKNKFARII
jgi:hypothetical protein